ncbi:hypothetical protein GNY17_10385 [Vibrio parahaemolyticus]|uniref:hypothetical protein n=1 Tax=Vibrio parahaemolyticus TaxID=670 RepID=UPI0004E67302|nr:hypothetical protein [Vibrio parahaemolyticus]ELA6921384.1 hypothetical protein [Vibrio parahaemolyticus]KFE94311.1 hypothetical protein HB39_15615 [Vibrio parahaemolyticus]MBE4096261.1 hypothetical protein [Vibrio parahaemolyticus]MBE4131189.1 hypothetical protein [Vibrio parahaemolyticus]MBM4853125.1 hypothetical protein [Vibrio parahaemolyticus]
MNISKTMPDFSISKTARAPAGMRCFINNEWNLVTHRGIFHNGQPFVVFRVARYRFSIAYGNVSNITKTTMPSIKDPIFVYEHFLRWKRAAREMGIASSQEQYLKETEYNAEELLLSLHLLDEAENFIKELKRRPKQSKQCPSIGSK